MKIKQYRNLFENWQRHLVEDEVEDAAEKAVAQNIPPGAAISKDELEQAEENVEAELRAVNDFENDANGLPSVVAQIQDIFGIEGEDIEVSIDNTEEEAPSREEQKERLFEIIKEELAARGILIEATTNRGGIEGQMAVIDWLYANEKVPAGYVAISNKSGSNLPDVTVVKEQPAEGVTPITKETKLDKALNDILKNLKNTKGIEDPVKARIEVKSSNSLSKDGTSTEVAFFDQTVGTSQVGVQKDEAYFGEALKEVAKIKNIQFKTTGDNYEDAAKHLEGKSGGEIFKAIMNSGHIKKDEEYVRCGHWGSLIAPDADDNPELYQEFDKTKHPGLGGVFTAQQPVYLGDEGASAQQGKGGEQWVFVDLNNVVDNKKQLFFYKKVPVRETFVDYRGRKQEKDSLIKYYFKITGKPIGEYEVGRKAGIAYVMGKTDKGDYRTPSGKSRQGANSGAMSPGCFSFEIKKDEVEDLISRTSQTTAGVKGGISASGAAEGAVIEGVKKHWTDNNDKYFAVVARDGKTRNKEDEKGNPIPTGKMRGKKKNIPVYEQETNPYRKIFMYKTGEDDPLDLNAAAATFDTSDTSRMFFATYGLADIGQVRAKVGAGIISEEGAENVLSISEKKQ